MRLTCPAEECLAATRKIRVARAYQPFFSSAAGSPAVSEGPPRRAACSADVSAEEAALKWKMQQSST